MKSSLGRLGAASFAVSLITLGSLASTEAATFLPADITVPLIGTTSSAETLTANVGITLVDPYTALLRVHNTTNAALSTNPEGPLLTRLGLNLAAAPAGTCITLDDPAQRFERVPPAPFCSSGHPIPFAIELRAAEPTSSNGVRTTEVLELVLRVDPACQDHFAFTLATFLDAPTSLSSGRSVQWAAAVTEVASTPGDACVRGNAKLELPPLLFTWASISALSAETTTVPSPDFDPRAGSLEVVWNGGPSFFDGVTTDAPYQAAIATLRNPEGTIVEQWQLNRSFVPAGLDALGCTIPAAYPVCYAQAAADGSGQGLAVDIPQVVASSNAGFEHMGPRVAVYGSMMMHSVGEPTDNSHQTLVVIWRAPNGLASAQLLLRARYDYNLDGLGPDDPFVMLLARNMPGLPPSFTDDSVRIVKRTGNLLVVAVNVQAALERARIGYVLGEGF